MADLAKLPTSAPLYVPSSYDTLFIVCLSYHPEQNKQTLSPMKSKSNFFSAVMIVCVSYFLLSETDDCIFFP